jgi:hypothetical protein
MKVLRTTIALPLMLIALTLVQSSRAAERTSNAAAQHVMLTPGEITRQPFPALGAAFSSRFLRAILWPPLTRSNLRCLQAFKFM